MLYFRSLTDSFPKRQILFEESFNKVKGAKIPPHLVNPIAFWIKSPSRQELFGF